MQTSGIYKLGEFGQGLFVSAEGRLLVNDVAISGFQGGEPTKDINTYKHHGPFGSGNNDVYHIAGNPMNAFDFDLNFIDSDLIVAMPFISIKAGTVDSIRFQVNGVAPPGGSGRLGIYKALSNTNNLYPGQLLVDTGNIAIDSNGIKETNISVLLEADSLYWFIYHANASARVYTRQTVCANILGWSSGTFPHIHLLVNHVYGSLPMAFPPSGFRDGDETNTVVIGVRYTS